MTELVLLIIVLNFPTSKVESIPDKKWDSRDKNTDQVCDLCIVKHTFVASLGKNYVQQDNKCLQIADIPEFIANEKEQFAAGSFVL